MPLVLSLRIGYLQLVVDSDLVLRWVDGRDVESIIERSSVNGYGGVESFL